MPPAPWPSVSPKAWLKQQQEAQLETSKDGCNWNSNGSYEDGCSQGWLNYSSFSSSSASQITTTFISVIHKTKARCWVSPADERAPSSFTFPCSGISQSSGNLTLIIAPHLMLGHVGQACPLWLLICLVNSIVLVLF